MSWLKDIRFGSKPLKAAEDFDINIGKIKSAESGVDNIDTAFKNLDYKQVGDEIHVNKARYRDMEAKFRQGEISSALTDADVATSITTSDEALLKETLRNDAPDIDVKELDTKIDSAKSFHSDLDVTSTSGADLESKLSTGSKEKANSMWAKIKKVVGVGVVATGVFTAVLLTDSVFDDIHNAANARNGCFLVYKSSNTQACKVASKSCGYGASTSTIPTCDTDMSKNLQYNIFLMVTHYVNTKDATNITALKGKGCTWPDDATADVVLGEEANIPILSEYYETTYPTFSDVPFVACDLVGSDYVGCVSCDPTQPTNSVKFTSSETLDGNMVYKCITNTSAIEAITDLATTLGVDIFSASGDSLSGSFQGNFLLAIIVILVLITAIALIFKFAVKKKDPKKETVSELDKSSSSTSKTIQQSPPEIMIK